MNTTTNNTTQEVNNNVINIDIFDTQNVKDFLSQGKKPYPITFDPSLSDNYIPRDFAITEPRGYTYTEDDDDNEVITITSRQGLYALLEDLSKSLLEVIDGYYHPGDDDSEYIRLHTKLMHALTDYDDDSVMYL